MKLSMVFTKLHEECHVLPISQHLHDFIPNDSWLRWPLPVGVVMHDDLVDFLPVILAEVADIGADQLCLIVTMYVVRLTCYKSK